MSEVPLLDLAPKLKRPLSLWNPIDYLLLLYWVFYFPQAILWYVETYCEPDPESTQLTWEQLWKLIQNSPIKRQFLIMGVFLVIVIPVLICLCLYNVGIPVDWSWWGLTGGISGGLLAVIAFSLLKRTAFGLQNIAFSIIYTIGAGIGFGLVLNSLAFGFSSGLLLRVSFGFAGSLSIGMSIAFLLGLIRCVLFGIMSGFASFALFSLAMSLAILRPDDWCFTFGGTAHSTPLRSPQLSRKLGAWLENDWCKGLMNVNQLTKYSWQFFAVDTAISKVLEATNPDTVLMRIVSISDLVEDWNILRYTSISLIDSLKVEFIKGSFLLPYKSWIADRWDASENLRFNKPYRAAAAGLFHLHQAAEIIAIRSNLSTRLKMRHAIDGKYYDKSYSSFTKAIYSLENLRNIKYGEELYQLACVLKEFTDAISIEDILQLKSISFPDYPELRPKTWFFLKKLESVVKDVHVLSLAKSRTARSYALNRVQGQISEILTELESLPANVSRIERPILYGIADLWKLNFDISALEIGQVEIDKPILNPYTIGDPVLGNRFIGREDILRQLEALWIVNASPQSVILYGHRRMGKTSILRNISMRLGSEISVAYINLLSIGSATNGITDILMAICDAITEATDIPAPNNNDLLQFPETTFRRHLQHINKTFTGKGLIIALDEFEKIEKLIEEGKLGKDFLQFLRGMVQMSSKIAFAFAGLHTLQEMNADYFQPFYASFIPISVAFLTRKATHQVLANPDPEFLLEYEPEALDYIYQLTNGQPYLTQLIGFQLVRLFNDYVFEQGTPRDRTFTIADVCTVCDGENFFNIGIHYFKGVWDQAAEGATGQQDILKALAPYVQGITESALIAQTNLTSDSIQSALNTLKQHDVIRSQVTNDETQWAIAIELFLVWVAKYKISA